MSKVVHRFVRAADIRSHQHWRVANRFNPFGNTQTILTDPANSRTLTLIGTTNSSTTLAHRTKKLLSDLQPDAVYVQACPLWWKHAQHVDVETQKLFSLASADFPHTSFNWENHLRGILFRLRYHIWKYTLESTLKFNSDFNLWTPGLETYFTLKHAQQSGAEVVFGGAELDRITIEALRVQPDMYPHTLMWRFHHLTSKTVSSWNGEWGDFLNVQHVRGGEAFAESIDRSRINFLVGLLSKVVPKQKKILIDERDERIFRELYSMKGKNIVAVVNQWHMEGIQTYWKGITGQSDSQDYNPVADMPIDQMQDKTLINEWLRDYVSGVTRSEPATWQDYLTNYHKENFQGERTRHINPQNHQDVPAPGEAPKSHHH